VRESERFYYHEVRLKEATVPEMLGPDFIEVRAESLATKRGELKVMGRNAKGRAFVCVVGVFFVYPTLIYP